jgi:hypothetical protein
MLVGPKQVFKSEGEQTHKLTLCRKYLLFNLIERKKQKEKRTNYRQTDINTRELAKKKITNAVQSKMVVSFIKINFVFLLLFKLLFHL